MPGDETGGETGGETGEALAVGLSLTIAMLTYRRPHLLTDAVRGLSEASAGFPGAEILIDGGQTLHGYPRWFSADYARTGADWTPHSGGDGA